MLLYGIAVVELLIALLGAVYGESVRRCIYILVRVTIYILVRVRRGLPFGCFEAPYVRRVFADGGTPYGRRCVSFYGREEGGCGSVERY